MAKGPFGRSGSSIESVAWGRMSTPPSNVVPVRLRLLDVWGGEDVIREISLAELETSERGVAVGSAFYPWRRVISYEWEIVETEPDEALARPRQLMVRLLIQGSAGPEERRIAADHFEVSPWTISMVVPERVEPESRTNVMRRITVPWHRVLEYERMLAEAKTAAEVPNRPDLGDAPRLPEVGDTVGEDGHVVIDVAAVERDEALAELEERPVRETAAAGEDGDDAADEPGADEESIAVGTGARVKSTVPNKSGQRRRRPRNR